MILMASALRCMHEFPIISFVQDKSSGGGVLVLTEIPDIFFPFSASLKALPKVINVHNLKVFREKMTEKMNILFYPPPELSDSEWTSSAELRPL